MQRILLLMCFSVFSAILCVAQDRDEIDRLMSAFERLSSETEATVDSLNALSGQYSRAYPDLTLQFCEQAIEISRSIGYRRGEGQSFLNRSSTFRTKGDVTKGLESAFGAYSVFLELGDSVQLAVSFNAIAACYKDLEQFDSALTFIRKALHHNAQDLKVRGYSMNIMGSVFIDMDELDSAEKYYGLALAIREEIKDLAGLGVTYGNMGILAIQKENDPALANQWYDRSIAIKLQTRDFFNLLFTYINKGNLFRNIGKYDSARVFYQTAADLADSINAKGVQAAVYTRWARSERRAGNEALAAQYDRKADEIYIEVLEERQATELQQLRSSYELANQRQVNTIQQQDIALLEKDKKLLWLRSIIFLGLALFLLALFWIQRFRKQKERELLLVQKEHLAEELEHKTNELSLFTVNFIQKQQMMEELNETLSKMRAPHAVNQEQHLRTLQRIISNQERNDKEWENFKVYFEKVHQDFFKKLTKDFPDLSTTELRLAALVKMNLNIKETASILSIAPGSVKTARFRLRTKLGLEQGQNLAEFLSGY